MTTFRSHLPNSVVSGLCTAKGALRGTCASPLDHHRSERGRPGIAAGRRRSRRISRPGSIGLSGRGTPIRQRLTWRLLTLYHPSPEQQRSRTVSSQQCGFRFVYLADWQAIKRPLSQSRATPYGRTPPGVGPLAHTCARRSNRAAPASGSPAGARCDRHHSRPARH